MRCGTSADPAMNFWHREKGKIEEQASSKQTRPHTSQCIVASRFFLCRQTSPEKPCIYKIALWCCKVRSFLARLEKESSSHWSCYGWAPLCGSTTISRALCSLGKVSVRVRGGKASTRRGRQVLCGVHVLGK